MIVPDQVDALVQSLFIGDSTDENEPAAGTMEDVDGRDYDEDILQAILLEGQMEQDEYEDEPMEATEEEGEDDDDTGSHS